ncbi:dihydrofolate reductase family protein [Streptomyces qinzhouensis]|uniref:Dihydrofolate reductase n=1 Tax=Streptomyces qinzhouensis TaxID=2599401 RepID=A0A5B8J5K1_9ACTN|nr:dihydrofolate reductase family protein [Streptomyces qinzhouensis]QDY77075.1 dihydrofolate reductase [Streptomyces qinzhouensis]
MTTEGRKIVAGLFVSLDGVAEAPEEWHFPYLDKEMGAAVAQMQSEADTLLMGRLTYETFASTWPNRTGPMAAALNGIRKLVASTTLTEAEWNNTTVIDGDVVAFLKDLKQQPGGNINLSGSISLTRTLLEAGLLDELRLMVHPIVLGTGKRLFTEDASRVPLRLTSSATFATGVLDLTYQPA